MNRNSRVKIQKWLDPLGLQARPGWGTFFKGSRGAQGLGLSICSEEAWV